MNLARRSSPGVAVKARPPWWREVGVIALFYAVYSAIRDIRGTRPVSAAVAYRNARVVIGLERFLGIFHEQQIQHVALAASRQLVQWLDVWYGSTQFLVTAALLVFLFFRRPASYRFWRNVLAWTTGLALIGFAAFPMMPPRLLPARYGFIDTLRVVGGLWDFESGPMKHLSNQFAAMPSLHVAWAVWCGAVLWACFGGWVGRASALVYPAITFFCVIVTANHLFIDAAAGACLVIAVYAWATFGARRRPCWGAPDTAAAGAGADAAAGASAAAGAGAEQAQVPSPSSA